MIKFNAASFIGSLIALSMAYKIWGLDGALFSLGLLMQSWDISITYTRRKV